MFYNHEFLTATEGGLAVVWLFATVGAKSQLKRLNRKAIVDVDVPRACHTILSPEVPIALRLQGNLLYGHLSPISVEKFSHYGLQSMTADELVREQLLIENDPTFTLDFVLPGLTYGMDNVNLASSCPSSGHQTSLMSTSAKDPSKSFHDNEEPSMLGLQIPPSEDTSALSGGLGFDTLDVPGSVLAQDRQLAELIKAQEDDAMIDFDPGFAFDAHGNMVSTEDGRGPERAKKAETNDRSTKITAKTRGLEEPGPDKVMIRDLYPGLPAMQHDQSDPQAAPFPPMSSKGVRPPFADDAINIEGQRLGIGNEENQAMDKPIRAPARRRQIRPQALVVDETTVIRNEDIKRWTGEYIAYCEAAKEAKRPYQKAHRAKHVAKELVTDLTNLSRATMSLSTLNHDFDLFRGDSLMTSLGHDHENVKKRAQDARDDDFLVTPTSSTKRRALGESRSGIRAGLLDPETGTIGDDLLTSSQLNTVELARDARPSLLSADDPTFPWNTTLSALVSRPGSSIAGHGSEYGRNVSGLNTTGLNPTSGIGRYGLVGGIDNTSHFGAPESALTINGDVGHGVINRESTVDAPRPDSRGFLLHQRRISIPRLPGQENSQRERQYSHSVNASPLQARSTGIKEVWKHDCDTPSGMQGHAAEKEEETMHLADDIESFQVHGPAAAVSTQLAADPTWFVETLSREAGNFLQFVQQRLTLRAPTEQGQEEGHGQMSRTGQSNNVDVHGSDIEGPEKSTASQDAYRNRSFEAESALEATMAHDKTQNAAQSYQAKAAVSFQALLPAGEHSAIVAAQALHHVLELTTKNIIHVDQIAPFAEIQISMVRNMI